MYDSSNGKTNISKLNIHAVEYFWLFSDTVNITDVIKEAANSFVKNDRIISKNIDMKSGISLYI